MQKWFVSWCLFFWECKALDGPVTINTRPESNIYYIQWTHDKKIKRLPKHAILIKHSFPLEYDKKLYVSVGILTGWQTLDAFLVVFLSKDTRPSCDLAFNSLRLSLTKSTFLLMKTTCRQRIRDPKIDFFSCACTHAFWLINVVFWITSQTCTSTLIEGIKTDAMLFPASSSENRLIGVSQLLSFHYLLKEERCWLFVIT